MGESCIIMENINGRGIKTWKKKKVLKQKNY